MLLISDDRLKKWLKRVGGWGGVGVSESFAVFGSHRRLTEAHEGDGAGVDSTKLGSALSNSVILEPPIDIVRQGRVITCNGLLGEV